MRTRAGEVPGSHKAVLSRAPYEIGKRNEVVLMARTAMASLIVAASLLVTLSTAAATEVYWTPAHELAPPVISGVLGYADLDGDGDEDVSVFALGRQYWNTGCPGPPSWQLQGGMFPSVAGCGRQSGTLGDVDADGDLDLVYACWECCSFRMVWNIGTPQEPVFQNGGAIAGNPDSGANARAWFGDIDAGGDLGLVQTSSASGVAVFENTGTPGVPCWAYLGMIPGINLGDSGSKLALGDLDGDGDLDIVAGTTMNSVRCWENVGTPQAWNYVESPAMLTGVGATFPVWCLALPDVDCDGDPDLLISTWSNVYLYLNERITPVGPTSWGTIKALYR
jgi:hypothetical protein